MSTTETTLAAEWASWHTEREATLREPHGWLSLTGLHWLDAAPAAYPGLPGLWRVAGADEVEVVARAADGLTLPAGGAGEEDTLVDGAVRLTPVDGAPGVLVTVGERKVEVIRRTDSFALRIRDPQAPSRTGFTGVPAFEVGERWVVPARFTGYPEPRRITVGAVVEGLNHFPTAVGTVEFELAGAPRRLVALAGKLGAGLVLHFRDATSGVTTYGGGRILLAPAPGPDGSLVIDFNRTANLPCAFTAYATCPLPPEENALPVAVEAGEQTPARPF